MSTQYFFSISNDLRIPPIFFLSMSKTKISKLFPMKITNFSVVSYWKIKCWPRFIWLFDEVRTCRSYFDQSQSINGDFWRVKKRKVKLMSSFSRRRVKLKLPHSKKKVFSIPNHRLTESNQSLHFVLAQQAAKDTGYSLIVIAGVAVLGGLGYLILRELYSRETPNGIYKESSKFCLNNSEVSQIERWFNECFLCDFHR